MICCPVASADMTDWIENKPEEKPLDFFVEIGLMNRHCSRCRGLREKKQPPGMKSSVCMSVPLLLVVND